MPRIENWTIISLHNNGHYQITGQAFNDHRTFDGDTIRTSSLKMIDFENGIAQTLNTKYELGKHAKGSTPLGKDIEDITKF